MDTVIISNDCVWPGNTDDDIITNYKDLLPIGLAYGASGLVRVDQTTNWDGKLALNWADTLSNGVNYKHADCNGDGIIDLNDIPSIIDNYGFSNGKSSKWSSYNAANPDLYFELSKDTIGPGDTVVAKIKLGRSGQQAQEIYGIAFRISFNASFIDSGSLSMDFNNSWLGIRDTNMVVLTSSDYNNGFMDVALTRIDHMPKDGDGELGALTFVTIDNLSGGIFELDFEETTIIDTAATLIPHNPLPDSTLVINGIADLLLVGKNVEIYPNPATDNIHIDAGNLKVQVVKLYDILGSLVLKQEFSKLQYIDINTSNIPVGVYILTLETNKGTVTRRVDIVK
ncbi:MAG: T9SS type A sorting domain-containing protein, partial [Bacteroidia bacterium]|nr:T9SS type A sorting domain-containing protein [Bacteroidia bacterium]